MGHKLFDLRGQFGAVAAAAGVILARDVQCHGLALVQHQAHGLHQVLMPLHDVQPAAGKQAQRLAWLRGLVGRIAAEGVVATLSGTRMPMTSRSLLTAAVRRPLGGLRILALIYWQALRLKLKGARYRTRPTPPTTEVT